MYFFTFSPMATRSVSQAAGCSNIPRRGLPGGMPPAYDFCIARYTCFLWADSLTSNAPTPS